MNFLGKFAKMRGTLLLLLALLTAASAWGHDSYISEVKLFGCNSENDTLTMKSNARSDGWTFVETDLNKGARGDYIFLAYKKSSDVSLINGGYVTNFYIKSEGKSTSHPELFTDGDQVYKPVPYEGCSGDNGAYFENKMADLNRGAGGFTIYLYYTKDNFEDKHAVQDISFEVLDDEGGEGALQWNNGNVVNNDVKGAADLNRGCGSNTPYIYMYVTTSTKKARPVTEPVLESGLAYNGKSQLLIKNAGSTISGGSIQFYSTNNPGVTPTNENLKNPAEVQGTVAGTYTVMYKVSDAYSDPTEFTLKTTIAKASDAKVLCENVTYGETLQPKLENNMECGETYRYSTSQNGNYTATSPTDVGTYYVKATTTGNNNCNAFTSSSATACAINKAPPEVTAPVAKNLIYTGMAQELVTKGKTTFGKLVYSLDDLNYSENVPTATDAKTYTVYYKVERSDNWESVAAKTVQVKISKATPEVTAPKAKENLTYTGLAQELVTEGSSTFGKLVYSLDGETYSEKVPTATDAETYTVYYKVESSDNWDSVETETVNVKISKAIPKVTAPVAKENLVYTGLNYELVIGGSTMFGKLVYSLDDLNYSENVPTATDAETYTVYYKVESSDNWDSVETETVNVKISKAIPKVTAPVAKENLTYTGSAQELVTKGATTFGKLLYSLDKKHYSEDVPTATDVATYSVYCKVGASTNWDSVETELVDVKIAPRSLTSDDITVSVAWSEDSSVVVKDGEKILIEETDYTVETNNDDATGIAVKTITGKGNYEGVVLKSLVPYIDENGEAQIVYDAVVLQSNKNGRTELSDGWYVAMGTVNMTGIDINGSANIILADGAELIVESRDGYNGIYSNSDIYIYGQENQTGNLNATGNYSNAIDASNITINGGEVNATNNYGDAINASNITINGGTVVATGKEYGIYGKIILDWMDAANDRITANRYYGSVRIADGKVFKDEDGNFYFGTLTNAQVDAIASKALTPAEKVLGADVSVAATWSQNGSGYDATIVVKDGEKELTEGTDYIVETKIDGSTGIVVKTVTGMGDYMGSVVKSLVPYIDENGEAQIVYDAAVLKSNENGRTELSNGWYVAMGTVNMAGIDINGSANIILADGAELIVDGGEKDVFGGGHYLDIYGQENQTGSLETNNIVLAPTSASSVCINGGEVSLTGEFQSTYVKINAGTVTVENGNILASVGNVTINGGSVIAAKDIRASKIILGWTDAAKDRITANSYTGPVKIADGKIFRDENGNVYSGTLTEDQIKAIAGKTLVPFPGKLLSDESIVVANIPVQNYKDGEPVCPKSIVVTDGKKTLKAGTDYTFECFNNTDLTSGTLDENAPYVKITGIGDSYAGEIEKRFFIWERIGEGYAAVQVYKDGNGQIHAEIDGAYDGTDAVNIDEDIENVTVKFNRTFTPNSGYATIMLPFDVNANNLDGVKSVIEFMGMRRLDNGDTSVGMAYVWCNKDVQDSLKDLAAVAKEKCLENNGENCEELGKFEHCNESDYYADAGKMVAYTPYMIEMESATLGINGNVTLKKTVTPEARVDDWVFRGTLAMHEWTSEEMKNTRIWGFAAQQQGDFKIGEFVPFGAGAWIHPFRAFMEYDPDGNNGSSGAPVPKGELGPTVASIDLPETMDVVIVSREGGEEHTTVIGRLNTRTGEIRLNSEGRRTFDLKGRSVGKPKAKGFYLKK